MIDCRPNGSTPPRARRASSSAVPMRIKRVGVRPRKHRIAGHSRGAREAQAPMRKGRAELGQAMREPAQRCPVIAREHRELRRQDLSHRLRHGAGRIPQRGARCRRVPHRGVHDDLLHVRGGRSGRERERSLDRGLRLGEAPHERERLGDVRHELTVARIERLGTLEMRDGIVPMTQSALEQSDRVEDLTRVGHQAVGGREVGERPREVSARVVPVVSRGDGGLQRAWRQPLRVLHCCPRPQRVALHSTADHPAARLREQAPRGDERRVELHRSLELGDRLLVLAGDAAIVPREQSAVVGIERGHVRRRSLSELSLLLGAQLHAHRSRHSARDVSLYLEQVLGRVRSIVALGPELLPLWSIRK